MERAHDFLNSLWKYDEQIIFEKLEKFTEDFNLMWDTYPYKKLFIRVFDKPDAISDFIKISMDCEFEEVIEEEISMSLNHLEFMCSNVLKEPLLNKLFINILNTKIPIVF
ncbi:MAG: hypothetical protein N4A63_09970 [Vallitalea sp.]|jgi:hypothetical protein|nr:hypothetical protein [Vallitalea sp.]